MVVATSVPGLWRNAMDQCPYCGHQVNGVGELNHESEPPEPGDFTLCIRCAGVSVFGPLPHMRLRKPDAGALERAYAEDPALQAAHQRAAKIILGLEPRH
jgi:hypothetical protein